MARRVKCANCYVCDKAKCPMVTDRRPAEFPAAAQDQTQELTRKDETRPKAEREREK